MPSYTATHRFARISVRKLRPILDLIRGKYADDAVDILKYMPHRGARMIEQVLKSAMANAEDRGVRNVGDLIVADARGDGGPMFKRLMPRARGMAYLIRRRSCHITIGLADLEMVLAGGRSELKIEAVNRPEIDAQLISEDIAEQLKKRSSFRRTMKRALEQTMDGGARGVKIQLSGRLGGSEMSRTEKANVGSVPLSTLRAKVDYGFAEAKTAQGHIGIKVWVHQGDYLKADAESPESQGSPQRRPRRPRGGGGGGGGGGKR